MKEVLKEADFKKIISIAEAIDNKGSITPAEAKKYVENLKQPHGDILIY